MQKLKATRRWSASRVQPSLYLMILPAFLVVLVYHYGPLAGLSVAFQRYDYARSFFRQEWTGFANFVYVLKYPNFWGVVWNTFFIATMKLAANMIVPITVSILINEMLRLRLQRAIQTALYLPHFISWVIVSGLFIDLLSPQTGAINRIITLLGGKAVYFMGEPALFPYVMVVTDVWKNFGFGTIIYLAALSGISPSLYEAAAIDGANRAARIRHIALPGIVHIVVLVAILNLGSILNAGFDQIFNMYNPLVYHTGDILDTLTYRIGIEGFQYDLATAIGMFKSLVSLVLVSTSYAIAYKVAGYRIF